MKFNTESFLILIYFLMILIMMKTILRKKLYRNKELRIILIYMAYVTVISILNGNSFNLVITTFLPILSIILFGLIITSNDIYRVISILSNFYIIILIIDLLTMILFREGIYITEHIYGNEYDNWFLGFRTDRIVFILPMLYCYFIKLHLLRRKFSYKFYSIMLITIID